MHSNKVFPIILVSANNNVAASKIISALIDDKTILNGEGDNDEDRVFRLTNKYYRADVRLQALVDGEPAPTHLSELIEAHIIYLNVDENEENAQQRLAQVGNISYMSQVRLVVCEGSEGPALAAWASRRRYELVPLLPDAHGEDELNGDMDVTGLPRVRAALHAHTWRGLLLWDRVGAPPPNHENALESEASCDSWGSWQGEGGGGGADSGGLADTFALRLGSLRRDREALGSLDDRDRRRQAEALLAAFTAALAPPSPPEPRRTPPSPPELR